MVQKQMALGLPAFPLLVRKELLDRKDPLDHKALKGFKEFKDLRERPC
jgi:hypothetical protein